MNLNREPGAGRQSQVYGVVGHPLTHTWSPPIHNAAFRVLGLNAVYLPFPLALDTFERELVRLGEQGLKGVNVTTPFKRRAAEWVDTVESGAATAGSVNTIAWSAAGTRGTSTDGSGFLADLADRGWGLRGTRAWCFGAGGAARAVEAALRSAGARVQIYARRPGAGDAIWSAAANAEPPDLIVNATPVGAADASELPIPWSTLGSSCRLYDLSYGRDPHAWLERGRSAGLETADGRGMLIHQAAQSIEWWTGRVAPIHAMWAAIEGQRR